MNRSKEEFNAHFQQVKERAFGRWTEILLALGVDAKVLNQRNQPCPLGDCGGTDRFQYTDKFGHGNYICRGCGAGGGFKLLMGCLGLNAVDALSRVDAYLGTTAPRPLIALAQDSRAERKSLIRKMLAETVPVSPGDEVDRYLQKRGVNLERYPSTLRMHPALGYYERNSLTGQAVMVRRYPAMVACVQDKSGHTVSLHRTYLSNGEKARECAVKKLLCAGIGGAAIRLAPSTEELAVCEGIETALAVMKRSHQPVWAGTSATNSAATGNVSMGNVAMDQKTLAPVRSSPFFSSRQNDFSGNTYTDGALSGITAGKAFANEGPVSKIVDAKITQQHVAAARKSASAAKSEAVAATNDKAAALSDALTHSQGTSDIQNASKGTNRARTEGFGQRTNELRQVAENVAKATGATEQQVATVAFGGAVEFKPGIPGVGSVGISARGAKDYVASIDQQLKEIKNKLSSEEVTKFKEWGEMLAKNTSLLNSVISDHRNGQEIAARLTNSVSRSERADATLREQEEYSRSVSGAFERGELMSIDLAKNPKNIDLFEALLSHGESSASAKILFDSHLGSIAKSPIIPSTTSNLPNSFKTVREIYHRDKSDPSLNPDLIKIHKDNKLKVNQKPSWKTGAARRLPMQTAQACNKKEKAGLKRNKRESKNPHCHCRRKFPTNMTL